MPRFAAPAAPARALAPALALALAFGAAAAPAAAQTAESGTEAAPAGPWYAQARESLRARLARQPNTRPARNVVLMIADGNGVASNYALRLWQGQAQGGFGEENVLPYEAFPHLALAKTYNTNAQTPDSAGTGTALQTGAKTRAGVVGVDARVRRGDCAAVEEGRLASIGDLLAEQGKAVGYVSTTRITHATPAAGYAKAADRGFEDDSELPAGCATPDIAAQLLDRMRAGAVRVALGGGRRHFLPREGSEEAGRRTDGRDLVAEGRAAGLRYAADAAGLAALDPGAGPILGLFAPSHMDFEEDRGSDQPSLAEMAETAVAALRDDPDGFFLLVEGGRIDHAHHGGNLHRALTDGVAFAEAVARVDALTADEDTLILVTADHAHALAFNGYCGRGTPITGLCRAIDLVGPGHAEAFVRARDGRPYPVAGYLNGPGAARNAEGLRRAPTEAEATAPDYRQPALIPTGGETHSGLDVAVYAKGPFAHLIDGTVEQHYLFHVMKHAGIEAK